MNYIEGQNREQIILYTTTLDNLIDKDNEVRDIDKFVNRLDMKELGFISKEQITGRPPYNPADLLKLYIYSYMNRTRSSREIEKDCKRNTEVMWLINNLQPDHNTIANFRRDNSDAIKKVFKVTVKIASKRDLIGAKLIAGDSVKLRAQNSKKNNYNKEKLENQIEYLNKKIDEYNQQLDSEDLKNQNDTTNKTYPSKKSKKQSAKSKVIENQNASSNENTTPQTIENQNNVINENTTLQTIENQAATTEIVENQNASSNENTTPKTIEILSATTEIVENQNASSNENTTPKQ